MIASEPKTKAPRTRVLWLIRTFASLRFRKRLGMIALLVLLLSICAGNLGSPPLVIRLTSKVGVLASITTLFLSEATYHFAQAILLSRRPSKEKGHWAFWTASGCTAVAVTLFVVCYIGIPLGRDIFTSSESRYGAIEGRVLAQDRRFVWLRLDGDERTFVLLIGPYVRVGGKYRITYLKHSLVVLEKENMERQSDGARP